MENKLCPYCGSEVYAGKHKHIPDKWIVRCGSSGEKCPFFPSSGPIEKAEVPKYLAAWNRRHVCPDKHGKPVYAGDEVKGQTDGCWQKGRLMFSEQYWCYGIRNALGFYKIFGEIELIESDGEECRK